MGKIIIQDNGKIRKLEDIELAEDIIEIKKNNDYWKVIDKLIEVWSSKTPDEVKALKINIDEYREVQHDKEYGQTLNGKDFERRFTLVFPQALMLMIRTQYKSSELPFDKKFFKSFAKRYPFFRVAQQQ